MLLADFRSNRLIKLENVTLRVKKIRQTRNGDFCIADLSTEIGEFKVKDPLLDQFDDGEYTGTVWISEIFLSQYIAWGKGVTEIRARLHDLQIDGMEELSHQDEPSEPDPAEEPLTRKTKAPAPELDTLKQTLADIGKKLPEPHNPETKSTLPDAALVALFGEELCGQIMARESFKLDATLERVKLREQAASLKQLGYVFDPLKQVWNAQ